jgi:hypothetical protein
MNGEWEAGASVEDTWWNTLQEPIHMQIENWLRQMGRSLCSELTWRFYMNKWEIITSHFSRHCLKFDHHTSTKGDEGWCMRISTREVVGGVVDLMGILGGGGEGEWAERSVCAVTS